jgi:hypothetical protein
VDGSVYVEIPSKISIKPGDFISAKITGAREYDLQGIFLSRE